jgi:hypothetical protein
VRASVAYTSLAWDANNGAFFDFWFRSKIIERQEKAEKYISKKAASYTIGSKILSKTIESSAPPPLYYNANIEASSSYKTSKGTVFSKTSRNIVLPEYSFFLKI